LKRFRKPGGVVTGAGNEQKCVHQHQVILGIISDLGE
jgi:hypothetical protein